MFTNMYIYIYLLIYCCFSLAFLKSSIFLSKSLHVEILSWFQGLEELLLQLRHRGLKVVSVGQLARLAQMEAIDPMIEAHL